MKKIILPLLLLVVVFAAATQFLPVFQPEPTRGAHLSELFARAAPGWEVKDLPLGSTENEVENAERILRFDDFVYREYRQQGRWFAVYVAYWAPKKMPVSMVASHRPDICWVNAGFKMTKAEPFALRLRDGTALDNGDFREFSDPLGRFVNVVYWHIAGRRTYKLMKDLERSEGYVSALWQKIVLTALPSDHQYFVRVSSNVPLAELEGLPAFDAAMQSARKLGAN